MAQIVLFVPMERGTMSVVCLLLLIPSIISANVVVEGLGAWAFVYAALDAVVCVLFTFPEFP